MPTWTSPKRAMETGNEEGKSEDAGSSEVKADNDNSMGGSDKSNSGRDASGSATQDLVSSPVAPANQPDETSTPV